jgi:hypothetical protein
MFDTFDTENLETICPECWECAEANAESPYGLNEIMPAYREQLQHCHDQAARDCLERVWAQIAG